MTAYTHRFNVFTFRLGHRKEAALVNDLSTSGKRWLAPRVSEGRGKSYITVDSISSGFNRVLLFRCTNIVFIATAQRSSWDRYSINYPVYGQLTIYYIWDSYMFFSMFFDNFGQRTTVIMLYINYNVSLENFQQKFVK